MLPESLSRLDEHGRSAVTKTVNRLPNPCSYRTCRGACKCGILIGISAQPLGLMNIARPARWHQATSTYLNLASFTMSTLQDEMAALNHRLDHKLNTLRRLRQRHKTIALCLVYMFCLSPALIVLLCFYQQSAIVTMSLVIAILISFVPPLRYCLLMYSFYNSQLIKAHNLKRELYSSFLNGETSSSNAIKYHNQLEEIDW